MKSIVIMGLPCSGKTTSSKYLSKNKNMPYYSTGDIVREMCAKEKGEDYTSEECGEFSTEKREEDVTYATKGALKKARREKKGDIVIFEGIRCKEEIDLLEERLEDNLTIFIEVPFEERARRMIERDRKGEEEKEEMKERDEREKGWGVEEVISSKYYDYKVNGNCSKEELYNKIERIVSSYYD